MERIAIYDDAYWRVGLDYSTYSHCCRFAAYPLSRVFDVGEEDKLDDVEKWLVAYPVVYNIQTETCST